MHGNHSILWEVSDPWRQPKQVINSLSLADLAISAQGENKTKPTNYWAQIRFQGYLSGYSHIISSMVSAESMILFCLNLVLFNHFPAMLPIGPVAQPEEPVGLFSLLKQPGVTTLSSESSTIVSPPYSSFQEKMLKPPVTVPYWPCWAPFPQTADFLVPR